MRRSELDPRDALPSCLDSAAKNLADRVRDVTTVLDTLPVAFGDYVNMSEVIAMGHSRGTVTSCGLIRDDQEPRGASS
jgi:hypothetical protein